MTAKTMAYIGAKNPDMQQLVDDLIGQEREMLGKAQNGDDDTPDPRNPNDPLTAPQLDAPPA